MRRPDYITVALNMALLLSVNDPKCVMINDRAATEGRLYIYGRGI